MFNKLKKVLFVVVLVNCGAALFAGDFDLPDVDDKYIGTYIPVDFENHINRLKNIYGAFQIGYPNHHDVLFLGKNICYSDAGFHDGYAIKAEDFKNYRFVTNDNGTYCIDEKGNSYHRISDHLNDNGYGYGDYYEYVVKLLLSYVLDMNTVEVNGASLKLDGVEYHVNFDTVFFDNENVVLWLLSEKNGWYALLKNGINGELHEGFRDEEMYIRVKDEVVKTFPMMFCTTENEFPYYWKLPKDQYRYLRNMVYARHGYNFKSADLKEFFSKFNWYKPNPDFSEDQFSNRETNYIKEVLREENERE